MMASSSHQDTSSNGRSAAGKVEESKPYYPPPFTVEPLQSHGHSIIWLHGRGSNATNFAAMLLNTRLVDHVNLREALPDTRFVFPTASRRALGRSKSLAVNQWFDIFSLVDPSGKEYVQVEGLRETSQYLHDLVSLEVTAVGAHNVALAGLSQGCASSLIALLLWDGEPLGAVAGMSGWLPFRAFLEDTFTVTRNGDDVFEKSEQDEGLSEDTLELQNKEVADSTDANDVNSSKPLISAISALKEVLEIDSETCSGNQFKTTVISSPIFLGHGEKDEKVALELGEQATKCLRTLGFHVDWHPYKDLAHWYCPQELSDFVVFMKERVGWKYSPG